MLLVPQFGRAPALPDLSPYKSGAELLERELFAVQLAVVPATPPRPGTLFLEPLQPLPEAHLVNRLEQGVAFAAPSAPRSRSWPTSST